jgi:hypothetical protein
MKTQAFVQTLSTQTVAPAEGRPPIGLRILFLLAGLAVVAAAQAPIAALASQVIA